MKALWEKHNVVVLLGSGGVGKTTSAAAMGVAAASDGLRTLVMTIDPAKRLANAMGLSGFGNVPYEITKDVAQAAGIELKAPLFVLMPNIKSTFDELMMRLAPQKDIRERIFKNRLYQKFSTVLVGASEYAACEKLYELSSSGDYDLIVVDTPPSQNARAFFDAPNRLLRFFDHEGLRLLFRDPSSSVVLKALGKMAGGSTIEEPLQFMMTLGSMATAFRERSTNIRDLLHADNTAFVVVTSASPGQIEAVHAHTETLKREGLSQRGLVINRVPSSPCSEQAAISLLKAVDKKIEPQERAALEAALNVWKQEYALKMEFLTALRHGAQDLPVAELSELQVDVHSLAILKELHEAFVPKTHL